MLLEIVCETAVPAPEADDNLVQPLYAGLRFVVMLTGAAPSAAGTLEGTASRAALSGVSFDVHAVVAQQEAEFGLAAMLPLTATTGGALRKCDLWLPNAEAQLAISVCGTMSRPVAVGCILRVRTSPEFAVSDDEGTFGSLLPDPKLENLWHMASCDPSDTVAMLFHFVLPSGFQAQSQPTLQVAFAYTVVIHDEPAAAETGAAEAPEKRPAIAYWTERRLRVITVQLGTSTVPKILHDSIDPPVVVQLLLHQALSAATDGPVPEVHALVREWLVQFLGLALDGYKVRGDQVTDALGRNGRFINIIRGVFGLIHSAALGTDRRDAMLSVATADSSAILKSELMALQPEAVMTVLYPTLLSFVDSESAPSDPLPLSREIIITSGAKAFLVDSHSHLLVYLCMAGSHQAETEGFPNLEKEMQHRQTSTGRRHSPSLRVCHAGQPNASYFDRALLDDRALPDGSEETFTAFAKFVEREVIRRR